MTDHKNETFDEYCSRIDEELRKNEDRDPAYLILFLWFWTMLTLAAIGLLITLFWVSEAEAKVGSARNLQVHCSELGEAVVLKVAFAYSYEFNVPLDKALWIVQNDDGAFGRLENRIGTGAMMGVMNPEGREFMSLNCDAFSNTQWSQP